MASLWHCPFCSEHNVFCPTIPLTCEYVFGLVYTDREFFEMIINLDVAFVYCLREESYMLIRLPPDEKTVIKRRWIT